MEQRLGLLALKEHLYDNEMELPDIKPAIFNLVEQQVNEIKRYPILTEGGLIGITGKTGTAKSTVVSLFHSAFFSKNGSYLNIENSIRGGSFLWLDTEMPENSDFIYFQKSLHKRLGIEHENLPLYKAVNLKFLSSNMKRYETVIDLLENSNNGKDTDYFSNLKVVVLDGIADVLNDTNNESEAREKLNLITSLLDAKKIGGITVLHTDKQGRGPRGFAGSMLENEVQCLLKTDQFFQADPFKISCEKIRGAKKFHPFYINFHEDGHSIILENQGKNILFDCMEISSEAVVIESKENKYKLL